MVYSADANACDCVMVKCAVPYVAVLHMTITNTLDSMVSFSLKMLCVLSFFRICAVGSLEILAN